MLSREIKAPEVVDPVAIERDILRDELEQARHTIAFLHGCLTDEGYRYDYPEQTVQALRAWEQQWPLRPGCVHSRTDPECPGCQARLAAAERRQRWIDLNAS
jgi:hypothetical protein